VDWSRCRTKEGACIANSCTMKGGCKLHVVEKSCCTKDTKACKGSSAAKPSKSEKKKLPMASKGDCGVAWSRCSKEGGACVANACTVKGGCNLHQVEKSCCTKDTRSCKGSSPARPRFGKKKKLHKAKGKECGPEWSRCTLNGYCIANACTMEGGCTLHQVVNSCCSKATKACEKNPWLI
jgi:hypothetical protein